MPDFEDIPGEIFRQILSYIPRDCYARYALVSQSWYKKVTPVLYENIEFIWRRPKAICQPGKYSLSNDICPCEELGRCKPKLHDEPSSVARSLWRHFSRWPCIVKLPCSDKSFPPLYLLVRTMISTPALAGLVRHLHLSGSVPRSVWTEPEQTELSHEDRNHIRFILRPGSQVRCHQDSWIRELDRGSPSAFAALLIMCLSNLRQLELGADFQQPLRFIDLPSSLAERLSQLHTASLGASREGVFMGNGRFPFAWTTDFSQLMLFSLPAIRHLSLNIPSPAVDTTLGWPQGVKSSLVKDLESLELVYTYLDEAGLAFLLEACPKLRTLKYDLWTAPPSRDPLGLRPWSPPDVSSKDLVDLSILERALSLVRNTLEIFHLHILPPFDDFNQYLSRMSFSDFPCLTTLHVPFQLLLGGNRQEELANALPQSLVHLWLNDDAVPLWLNHDQFFNETEHDEHDYYSDPDYVTEFPDGVRYLQVRPLHTDAEVVRAIANYLADFQKSTPFLKTLNLLLYEHLNYWCWDQRDDKTIADLLKPCGQNAGIDVSVIVLPERTHYSDIDQSDLSRSVRGQGPPYFDLNTIQRLSLPNKEPESSIDCMK